MNEETMEGFGVPDYNNSGKANYLKEFSIKEGHNHFRIFPPVGAMAATGTWKIYAGKHFGYSGLNPRDPAKTIPRPFMCIEERDFDTKMILRECPESTLIETKKQQLTDLTDSLVAQNKQLQAAGQPLIDIESHTTVKALREWLFGKFGHKCSWRWRMFAMDSNGVLNVLAVSNTTRKLIDEKFKDARGKGIDPLNLKQGVWIDIIRVGNGFPPNPLDTVELVREDMGNGMERIKAAPISNEIARQAIEKFKDLSAVIPVIGAEQIKELTMSNDDPEIVDHIFNRAAKIKAGAASEPMPEWAVPKPVTPDPAWMAPSVPAAVAPVQLPVQPPVVTKTAQELEIDALRAKLAMAEASLVHPPTAVTPAPVTPQETLVGTPPAPTGTPEEDFLRKYRLPAAPAPAKQ